MPEEEMIAPMSKKSQPLTAENLERHAVESKKGTSVASKKAKKGGKPAWAQTEKQLENYKCKLENLQPF